MYAKVQNVGSSQKFKKHVPKFLTYFANFLNYSNINILPTSILSFNILVSDDPSFFYKIGHFWLKSHIWRA